MKDQHIAFIGAGNMAGALIRGLIHDAHPVENIIASDPSLEAQKKLRQHSPIQCINDNLEAAANADILVFTVKPQILAEVIDHLHQVIQAHKPLVISVAAGINTQKLQHWLGENIAITRAMPNTPAMLQAGATALYAPDRVTNTQRDLAESLMRSVGITVWLDDESLIDVVTAVSGSGPAYFFLMMEAITDAATQLGLGRETASLLTLQTALGASRMAIESEDLPRELRGKVTSPGGTTEAALASFDANNYKDIIQQAIQAAFDRAKELAT